MAIRVTRAILSKYISTGVLDVDQPPIRHKYGARATTVDGVRFDSAKEASRYAALVMLQRAGAIRDLERQPRFPLDVVALARPDRPVVRCGFYTADFRYFDTSRAAVVVEDVKSGPTRTTAYRLRKRLVEAIHGIAIVEV